MFTNHWLINITVFSCIFVNSSSGLAQVAPQEIDSTTSYLPGLPAGSDSDGAVDIKINLGSQLKDIGTHELDDTYPSELVGPIDEFNSLFKSENINFKASKLSLTCNPVEFGGLEQYNKVTTVVLNHAFYPIIERDYVAPWLPPDPGSAGRVTIAGIDSDQDCVRDDIERSIVWLYPGVGDVNKRKYLFEYARWLQAYLNNNYVGNNAREAQNNTLRAYSCAKSTIGSQAYVALENVFIETHNTYDRSIKRIQSMEAVSGYHSRDLGAVSCVF